MSDEPRSPRTRGYRKRERTRSQLIQAGLRVLAEKGDALTASDVVTEADVSSGTFYNYFVDREALIAAVAEQIALSIAEAAAREPITDPARRFALATARVLQCASEDQTWARAVLRLVGRPDAGLEIARYLREDLSEGEAQGRFDFGPDEATLDQIAGLVLMTIRRIADGRGTAETARLAVERGLRSLGLTRSEAAEIAFEVLPVDPPQDAEG